MFYLGRGGGGQVEKFPKDPLVFVCVCFQEVRYQGRVCGSVENFDNNLLVFGHGFLFGIVQIEVLILSGEKEGLGLDFCQGSPCFGAFSPGGERSGEGVGFG